MPAAWDALDLYNKFRRYAQMSPEDEGTVQTDIDAYLTEAEAEILGMISAIVPESQYAAPVKMTTTDNGYTYSHASGWPMGSVEIRESRIGRLMIPGAEYDSSADFATEGATIRFPGNRPRTFTDGPYLRGSRVPMAIDSSLNDATHQPVVQPATARILIVYRALQKWANSGGLRDPRPYEAMESKAWAGDPSKGDYGILGMLRKQYDGAGVQAVGGGYNGDWWNYIDTGSGYTRTE